MKKVKLYWWNTKLNVGDYASYYLVSKLFNGKIKRKDPTIRKRSLIKFLLRRESYEAISSFVYPFEKYIAGIGSIVDHLDNNAIVWGCGCRHEGTKCPNKAIYYLVRGNLTVDVLKSCGIDVSNVLIGDPGLLMPLIYTPKVYKNRKNIVVIPHYNDYDEIYIKYKDIYTVLDVRTTNIELFIDNVASADFIISSSLHGLIFANAYGIPAVWFKHNYINSSDFKFYDYLSSIGIRQYAPITNIEEYSRDEIEALKESRYCICCTRKTIEALQQNILSAWKKIINKHCI